MIKIIKNLDNYSPKNEYSIFIKDYFKGILKDGTKRYIKNIDVEVQILDVNWTLIPITFWNLKNNNCFSSSVLWMFQYLWHETKNINNIFLKIFIYIYTKINIFFIKILRLDLAIFVNNNLLSTNIYPDLKENDFIEIQNFLLKKYPKYTIIFRTLNGQNKKYLEILKKLWFSKIIFRQIYLSYKEKKELYLNNKYVKQDRKMVMKSRYEHIYKNNYSNNELKEIKECYDNLYLKKYSFLNPQLTFDFFKIIQQNNYFFIKILKNKYDQKINAAYGCFMINNQITAPVFWYKNDNLYRNITLFCVMEWLDKAEIMNCSSWVWQFKMNRWAEKTTEYFLIYYKHLSFFKKLIWSITLYLSENIWERYLKNNIA